MNWFFAITPWEPFVFLVLKMKTPLTHTFSHCLKQKKKKIKRNIMLRIYYLQTNKVFFSHLRFPPVKTLTAGENKWINGGRGWQERTWLDWQRLRDRWCFIFNITIQPYARYKWAVGVFNWSWHSLTPEETPSGSSIHHESVCGWMSEWNRERKRLRGSTNKTEEDHDDDIVKCNCCFILELLYLYLYQFNAPVVVTADSLFLKFNMIIYFLVVLILRYQYLLKHFLFF